VNPSTACAGVLVDELVRGGVREAVLSPGSRSAPLAYALHAADRADRLRLHVRVDERSAGFLALGLAKASGVPVPVVTTSGTAAAELHAAVLEAHHAGVPLIALTADRPAELLGTGANQTTEQAGLYGGAVRLAAVLPAGDGRPDEALGWRALVCRALAAAAGDLSDDPGPVHLDVALRDPLVPDGDPLALDGPLAGRPGGEPWTVVSLQPPAASSALDGDRALGSGRARTLVVVGDCPPEMAQQAGHLARRRGWPVVAEPTGAPAAALPHGSLLLGCDAWLAAQRPQRVLVVGRPTLSRAVQRLLADRAVEVEVVTAGPRWADPARSARAVYHRSWLAAALREEPTVAGAWAPDPAPADADWARQWVDAAAAVAAAVAPIVAASWPSGPAVARTVLDGLPPGALLVLGSSNPVRDVDVVACPRDDVTVLANRGLAGIDGTVSTAWGAALAYSGPAYALLGDLTFLHDANGLLVGRDEPRPDLAVVVVSDDGGSMFALLEHGAPEREASFERVFGTPTGADLAALCEATGTAYERADDPAALRAALAPRPGVRVVEVRVPRDDRRELAARLSAAAAAALA
jgi:2-succinyl-5-enolpyruvyl-6-hydroxy-3-cyclohexene-1-carboxylate synthase